MSPLIHRALWLKTAFEPDPIRTLFLSKCGNRTGNAPKETKPAANTQPGKSRRPHIRPGCLQQATEHTPLLGHIPASTVLNNKHCFHRETPSKSRKLLPLQFERLLQFSTAQNVLGPSQGRPGRGREQPRSTPGFSQAPRRWGEAMAPAGVQRPLPALTVATGTTPGDTGQPTSPLNSPVQKKGTSQGEGKGDVARGGGGRERDDSLSRAARRTPKASEEQGKGAAEGCPRPFRHPEARQVCLLGEEARPSR